MPIADVHCHLGMYSDAEAVRSRARAAGVTVVVATSRASEYRGLIHHQQPDLQIGLGMHPECAGSIYAPFEVEIFEREVASAAWISEVGLDGVIADRVSACFGQVPDLGAQQELFDTVLSLAGPDKIYSVHSRGAASLTVQMLTARACQRVIMHGFDGGAADRYQALEAGYHFSIHPAMLETEAGRELVRAIPANRMLLETDGPFFQWRGTRLEPGQCPRIVAALAAVRGDPADELAAALAANFAAVVTDIGAQH